MADEHDEDARTNPLSHTSGLSGASVTNEESAIKDRIEDRSRKLEGLRSRTRKDSNDKQTIEECENEIKELRKQILDLQNRRLSQTLSRVWSEISLLS